MKPLICRSLRLIAISAFLFQQASAQAAGDFPSVAESYLHCKKDLKSDHGVSPNLNIVTHYQKADLDDDEQALGWIFRFQGGWTAFARDSGHCGTLKWRVEDRSGLGGEPSPSQLGGNTGVAVLNPGFGYSDRFDTDLSILSWTQCLWDNRAEIVIGRLAFDLYLDPMRYQTFSRGFFNRAFILNPSIGTTGIGALGAFGKVYATDQIWVTAQAHDGNAVSGEFDWDTVEEHEYLKAVAVGWSPSRARSPVDRILFTVWTKDEREVAGKSKGGGWVVSVCYEVADGIIPFTRFGHSDGGAGVGAEDSATLGCEVQFKPEHIWYAGAGWAKPSTETFGEALRDEYVLEASYTWQVSRFAALTPDVQLLIDPAQNPDEDQVWVGGVRLKIDF